MEQAPYRDISDRLRRLARVDKGGRLRRRKVFGAELHAYELSKVPLAEVSGLERDLGVALPAPYREFLVEVGSGAGPYYGLYPLEKVREEVLGLQIEADDEGLPRSRPDKPFPLTRAEAEAALRDRQTLDRSVLLDGCLIIGHQGSGTQWSVLVVQGDLTGTVWDLGWFVGLDGEWWPARVPPGVLEAHDSEIQLPAPPSFTDWYLAWLANAEYGIANRP